MYYQDNNIEHRKVIYPPYSRNCQILQKKNRMQNKQRHCYSLQLKGCAHYSFLVDITHYWLFKFLVEVRFQVSRHVSRGRFVNVNCKYASEEIYHVLLKQQSTKSSITKSCCKLYHYQQSARNSANFLFLPKNLLDEITYRFKTTVHKELLKTLGAYLFCEYK